MKVKSENEVAQSSMGVSRQEYWSGVPLPPYHIEKKKKSVSTKWLGSLPKITQLVKQAAVLKPRIKSRALTQLYVYRNVHS